MKRDPPRLSKLVFEKGKDTSPTRWTRWSHCLTIAWGRTARREVQVLGDSRPVLMKRLREQAYSPSGLRQVVVIQVAVEQVDVPRPFDIIGDVGLDDLACDGQGRVLRCV